MGSGCGAGIMGSVMVVMVMSEVSMVMAEMVVPSGNS